MAYMQEGIDDVVFLNLEYPGKVIANIHVSWLDPQKVRKMIIVGSRKMVVYDDIAENKIPIYDKGIDRRAILGENMDFDSPRRSAVQLSHRRYSDSGGQVCGAAPRRSGTLPRLHPQLTRTAHRASPTRGLSFRSLSARDR